MAIGNGLRVTLAVLAAAGLFASIVALVPPGAEAPVTAAPAAPLLSRSLPEVAAESGATAPRFDVVRVEPDGSAVVAGRAEPGGAVAILSDAEVAAEAVADAEGRFVAFLSVPPSAAPSTLALRRGADGALSEETVILGPIAVAEAHADLPDAGGADESAGPGSAEAEVATVALATVSAGADGATGAESDDRELPPAALAEVPKGPDAAAGDQASAGIGFGEPPVSPSSAEPARGLAVRADPLPQAGSRPDPRLTVADVAPGLGDPAGPAQARPPVLVSDAEGVRVVQPSLAPGATPEVLSTVALDAITYDAGGEVAVAGRGAGGGAVRLYLDNEVVAEAPIGPDGRWSADLASAAPGVYTLRVDQVGLDGEVVSRIETPFQREERRVVAAALAERGATSAGIAMRTVQPGSTLWAISRDRWGDGMMYVRVFEANRDRIRDPDLIYPGQVFMMPPGR